MVVLLLLALQEEDPRRKAVREAFEEQLRRERSEGLYLATPVEDALVKAVQNGEGLDRLSHADGLLLLEVWGMEDSGRFAFLRHITQDDIRASQAAVRLLNQFTGQSSPLPTLETRRKVREDWEAWFGSPRKTPLVAACDHSERSVRAFIKDLGHDDVDTRTKAEGQLKPCAAGHTQILEAALAETTDVEAAVRLRAILKAVSLGENSLSDLARTFLSEAHRLLKGGDREDALELLRAGEKHFQGAQRATLNILLRALERRG